MLSWLTSRSISTVILTYTSEDIADALYPLSTWFEDDSGNKVIFHAAPVLIFDQVLWEAEDGSDAYRKRMSVTNVDDLPEDFLTFVEKVS
jgi:hypothetical protein